MGKSARKGKKNKINFDEFFDSTKPQSEGDGVWHSGVSAMMLDEGAAAAEPAAGPGPAAAAAAAAADAMDTADVVPLKGSQSKQKGLKLQQSSLKIAKRGNKTTAQKKRKAAKQEKALALAEKMSSKATKQLKKKQHVAALKTLYS